MVSNAAARPAAARSAPAIPGGADRCERPAGPVRASPAGTGPAGRSPVRRAGTVGPVRHLVLSDVHADPVALERVLEDARGRWDRLLLLGDLVGYGPDAASVVSTLRALAPAALVRGNHEAMMFEILAGRRPRAAEPVVRRLREHAATLTAADLDWLAAAPLRHEEGPSATRRGGAGESAGPGAGDGPVPDGAGDDRPEDGTGVRPGLELVHGSTDPQRPFDYLLSVPAVRAAAPHARRELTLVGHSHVPGGFVLRGGRWLPVPARREEVRVALEPGTRALLNPGSTSLPRDGGPAGGYLIWDDERREATIRRVGP